jgi:hypothetical protein
LIIVIKIIAMLIYWKLGPKVLESFRGGAYWEVVRSLEALLLEEIKGVILGPWGVFETGLL